MRKKLIVGQEKSLLLKKIAMGIFSRKKKEPVIQPEERAVSLAGLNFNSMSSYSNQQAMRLSAVYLSTQIISNSVAVLPFSVYKVDGDRKIRVNHNLTSVLNLKPEKKLTHFQWMKMMIESVLLKGNGYAYIVRDEQLNVVSLQYIDSDFVTPMIQPDGSVKYLVTGMSQAIDAVNMIHLFLHVDQTFRGISVISYASQSLETAQEAEKHADNFFKSGANLSGIIKASSTLTNEQKKQIQESWRGAFNNGSDNKVSVAVLPQGLDYQPISVTPEDAELLSSRKYNVVEIARFFGVSPWKLFEFDGVSYNSMEWAQISFLQDTIQPIVEMIKDEFNTKLFKPSQTGKLMLDVDYTVLMSTDKETEASYYKSMLVNGIMTLNEVRNKLGLEPTDDGIGDKHWIQISYATMDNVAEGKYIKGQEQGQNQETDNNVKKTSSNKASKTKE